MAAKNPDGTSVPIVLTIITYNGTSAIDSLSQTLKYSIPTSVKPTVSLSYEDASGCFDKYGKYVQGKSLLDVSLTMAGVYGSEITSQNVNFDGKSYLSESFSTDLIKSSGELTLFAQVRDTRNRSGADTEILSVLPYKPPQISDVVVERCNSNAAINPSGDYLAIRFDASVSSLENKNSAKYLVKYKKVKDSEYTTEELTVFAGQYAAFGVSVVIPADKAYSYDIIVCVEDDFGPKEKSAIGPPVRKLFSWLAKGLGFAFGKVAELENVLDIAFKTYMRGGMILPTIPAGVDFNDLKTSNRYTSLSADTAAYLNCPISSGTFTLDVIGNEGENQITQIVTQRSAYFVTYVRHYYGGIWTGWLEPIYDSGWQQLTVTSGEWTYAIITARPQYRRIGKTVYLRGLVSCVDGAGQTIATLPEGFRPGIYYNRFSCAHGTNGNTVCINIDSNGAIKDINKSSTSTIRNEISLDGISFIIN